MLAHFGRSSSIQTTLNNKGQLLFWQVVLCCYMLSLLFDLLTRIECAYPCQRVLVPSRRTLRQ